MLVGDVGAMSKQQTCTVKWPQWVRQCVLFILLFTDMQIGTDTNVLVCDINVDQIQQFLGTFSPKFFEKYLF
jgi:hypothetical protein